METEKKLNSVCFFMAGTLFDFNLKVAEQLRHQNPDINLSAFVCGRRHLLKRFECLDNTKNTFNRYDWLNEMITQWLSKPYDKNRLEHYRGIFGDDLLRRLITADRELGYGYVTGGIVERTKLIDICLKKQDMQWRYVVGLLDYCFDLLENQKPDIVYFYVIAGMDAMGLKIVADYLNIPAVQISYARINDFYTFDGDIKMLMPHIKKQFDQNDPIDKNSEEYKIASSYVDDFINRPQRPKDAQVWFKQLKKNNHPLFFLKTLAIDIVKATAIGLGLQGSRGIWRQRYGRSILQLTIQKFIQTQKYMRQGLLNEQNLKDTNYVYYPLHYDPEMTTIIMSDKNTDQIAVIESITKQMPAGWKLIVKDHIPMIGRRPKEFMKRLKKIPDVVVASPFDDNFSILQNANCICTLTGTVGWEALLLGKVPVVIGYPHYINLSEGIIRCEELTHLKEAIKKSMEAKAIDSETIKRYITILLQNSFELPTDYFWFGGKVEEERLHDYIIKFTEELKKLVH